MILEKRVILKSGIEIAYFDFGVNEKVLLCVHGLGSNKKAFIKNIFELGKYFRVVALDLPNYGNSSKGDYPSTMIFFVQIIKEFADALNLERVALCGHSMGGQISILTALNYPDLVEKLILIAPAGIEVFSSDEIKRIEKYFTSDAIKNATDKEVENSVKLNFYKFPSDAQFIIAERIQLKKSKEFDYYCLTVSRAFKDMLLNPVFDVLEKINIPTILFFGLNDALIPNKILHPTTTKSLAEEACKKMKKCKLILIDECGHFLHFEKPEIFNHELISFLA